jgi:hypothetical protein
MKRALGFVVMAAMAYLVWGAEAATPVKKKAPVKKGAATSASKKAPAKKAPAKTGSATAASRKKGPPKKAVTWRNRQVAPSPERYREIQNALVAKGYLNSEDANGSWNQNSIDALKKFQGEQNLESSGKINSLSLIALGLGPRREAPTAAVQAPKVPQ